MAHLLWRWLFLSVADNAVIQFGSTGGSLVRSDNMSSSSHTTSNILYTFCCQDGLQYEIYT